MGSNPSKHTKPKRSLSAPQISIRANGHVPVRRTATGINSLGIEPNDSSLLTKKSDEAPYIEFPEEEYRDGRLGITTQEKIRKILGSLDDEKLFTDTDFPADTAALFFSDKDASMITWKRPKDLVEEWQSPQLISDGATRDDIKQGILGDCWFLSACAAVSQRECFMKKIVPSDQSLSGEGYKGSLNFRFWRFGQWEDVYIDDLLPTADGKLIYGKCTDPCEFWVAFVEKAYAKLHGSYEAIEGGQTMDALVDLTGGLAERHIIQNKDPQLYRIIERARSSGAFITCSRKGDWRFSNKADPNGLVSGHAYTITAVRKIKHQRGEEKMVRIRNPWGDNNEWKGSWSDNDINWNLVNEDIKQEIGLQSKDDGEFWMSYRDFCKQFQEVTICLTGPDFEDDEEVESAGHVEVMKGEWIAGKSGGVKSLQIGFVLYKTDHPNRRLDTRHFRYHHDCGRSGVYINYREVSQRFQLEPGHYVIIPSTYISNETACFMLRVFGEKKFTLKGLPPLLDAVIENNINS
ncbi:CAPNN [Mytilus edulis]|uniref:CAPNN n=1 Tax=Mytilus edulis TaxID=6550 RepID=A0A8S3TE45_MYTED|nr:CAPNN [Mytilus edulis]